MPNPTTPRKPSIADLPSTARVFAEVIGIEATVSLANASHHANISIPRSMESTHWIAHTVGMKNAELLARHFGGCLMPLAACKQFSVAHRQYKVALLYRDGAKDVTIAETLGVSLRVIRNDLDAVGLRKFEQRTRRPSLPPGGLGTYPAPGKRGVQTGAEVR